MRRSFQLPFSPPTALRVVVVLALLGLAGNLATAGGTSATKAEAPGLPAALTKEAPETLEDVKAIQKHVKKLLEKLIPCTVNVRIGQGQGSGVIVSEDGFVLTAGHVSGTPGREVVLTLHDGRKVKGKTLGANGGIDSGMIQITDKGKWPFVGMGKSAELGKGQWCLAVGHPGGWQPGRTPVVRLGRILDSGKAMIRTDCVLVGGDSGGPLFDMHGKVIGIHSRIAKELTSNIHVPVDTYRDTWDKLAAGESWGGRRFVKGGRPEPYMGVQGDLESKEARIILVAPGSPAEKAGLKVNDVITRFGSTKVGGYEELVNQIQRRRPGDEVMLEVLRGEETVQLKLIVGRRPG
jgi:serine protease Do